MVDVDLLREINEPVGEGKGSVFTPESSAIAQSYADLASPVSWSVPGAELIYGDAPTFGIRDDGYFDPGSSSFPDPTNTALNKAIVVMWEDLVGRTFGVDEASLDFPTNWWPGLEVENQYGQLSELNRLGRFGGEVFIREDLRPEDWATRSEYLEAVDQQTGLRDNFWIRYDPSRAAQQFAAMSNETRAEFNSLMVDAKLMEEGWKNVADYSMEGASAFAGVLSLANYYGISAKEALQRLISIRQRNDAARGGGGRGRGPTVKLEIPDYETMLADAKNLLKSKLNGRDPKDWEMSLVADHMKERYGQWADAKKRALLGGNGTYEIPDPVKLTSDFVQETYAAEIGRLQDVAETGVNNSLLLRAATKGLSMIGGYGG